MIKVLLFDLSRTLLFPKDINYKGELNKLHKELSTSANYNFLDHFYLDEEILIYLSDFKNKCNLCIFTSGSIQNAPEIRSRLDEVFERIYSAEEIGFGKKDMESYKFITEDLKVEPREILFVDDSVDNVDTAKSAGLNAITYTSFIKLKEDLEAVLPSN
ncbi:hypothetical protein A2Z22_00955 [Candidatus Woesebacteria bacterium RBG_16_34_12]|uniref:FCP1 homology domain-containing protein n=1 Tax=Candidatus Woesebacteria bacterium RBG_16_34_12 TaxID=1802480 RepID=A0A1F7X8U4_9BACT|nr:MAG: hypothetical protein A2Z22_00955 [Candidatus Woesebacteria bacterium RBG_16_34_12]